MAKKRKRKTFVVVSAEAKAAQRSQRTGKRAVRPGTFNAADELFDPAGHQLWLEADEVSPGRALALVRAGALVAHESCGCGGGSGCQPVWARPDQRRAMVAAGLPAFPSSPLPSWIEEWRDDRGGSVVFAHGAVDWAAAFEY